jgi:hypothetical protein
MLGWPGTKVCPCNMTQRSRTRTTAFYPMIPFILVILSHETILLAFPKTFPILLSSLDKQRVAQAASHCKFCQITRFSGLAASWTPVAIIKPTVFLDFSHITHFLQQAYQPQPGCTVTPSLHTWESGFDDTSDPHFRLIYLGLLWVRSLGDT